MCRLLIFLLFCSTVSFAQNRTTSFSSIDWKVKDIDAPTPDSLAKLLTTSYTTELEKTRAIYSWIAQHISYNMGILNPGKYRPVKFVPEPDTISSKSAIEQTAERVLRRRIAVCDGYAKLFKTLCDYAGLQSELVLGYAKCYLEKNEKFRTNHTWNAIRIDSSWYLLDATWGSGYVNYADEYIAHLDETYFLTPPKQFILDHYPEDLKWTLMDDPPTLREFKFSPFKYRSFIKYGIQSVAPSQGTIEASVGDTLRFQLTLSNPDKDIKIAADPFIDSVELISSGSSVFLRPVIENKKAIYTYVVDSDKVEWIHLVYNNDPVLRYRINTKKGLASN